MYIIYVSEVLLEELAMYSLSPVGKFVIRKQFLISMPIKPAPLWASEIVLFSKKIPRDLKLMMMSHHCMGYYYHQLSI